MSQQTPFARAKQRIENRRDRYVVGYSPTGNPVYGKTRPNGDFSCVTPMTAFAAKRELKRLPCEDGVIFKLVPVRLR